MPRQLKQNINFIFENLRGDIFCGRVQNFAEAVNIFFKLLGYVIHAVIGIKKNFKARLVVAGEKMFAEKGDDVKSYIGRNVSDANFLVAGVFFDAVLVARNIHEKFIEAARPIEKLLAANVEIVQVENQILIIFAANLFC